MTLRLVVQDDVVYEGASVPVPRVGELIERDGQLAPVESLTWEFHDNGLVVVTLGIGDRPYSY